MGVPVFTALWVPVAVWVPAQKDDVTLAVIAVPLLAASGLMIFLCFKTVPTLRRELHELGGS